MSLTSSQIIDSLLTATSEIVKSEISKVSFDKTIKCQIKDISQAEIGKYIVTNENVEYEAYSNNSEQYEEGDYVFVTVPQGDYSNQKIILGKVTKELEQETEKVKYFSYPLDQIVKLEKFNLTPNVSNSHNGLFINYDLSNQYTRLGMEAEFNFEYTGDKNITSGDYGVKLWGIVTKPDYTLRSEYGYWPNNMMIYLGEQKEISELVEETQEKLNESIEPIFSGLNGLQAFQLEWENLGKLTIDKLQQYAYYINKEYNFDLCEVKLLGTLSPEDMTGQIYNTQIHKQSINLNIEDSGYILALYPEFYNLNNFTTFTEGLVEELDQQDKLTINCRSIEIVLGYGQEEFSQDSIISHYIYSTNVYRGSNAENASNFNTKILKFYWIKWNEDEQRYEAWAQNVPNVSNTYRYWMNTYYDSIYDLEEIYEYDTNKDIKRSEIIDSILNEIKIDNYEIKIYEKIKGVKDYIAGENYMLAKTSPLTSSLDLEELKKIYDDCEENLDYPYSYQEINKEQYWRLNSIDFAHFTPYKRVKELEYKILLIQKENKNILAEGIIKFTNETFIGGETAISEGLDLHFDQDTSFYVYNEFNQHFGSSTGYKIYFSFLDGEYDHARIKWIFPPTINSMLIIGADNRWFGNPNIDRANTYTCTYENISKKEIDKYINAYFDIAETYTPSHLNNEIKCEVTLYDENNNQLQILSGNIEFKFGYSGNNGSQYKFNATITSVNKGFKIEDNKNTIDLEFNLDMVGEEIPENYLSNYYEKIQIQEYEGSSAVKEEEQQIFAISHPEDYPVNKYKIELKNWLENSSYTHYLKCSLNINNYNLETYCAIPIQYKIEGLDNSVNYQLTTNPQIIYDNTGTYSFCDDTPTGLYAIKNSDEFEAIRTKNNYIITETMGIPYSTEAIKDIEINGEFKIKQCTQDNNDDSFLSKLNFIFTDTSDSLYKYLQGLENKGIGATGTITGTWLGIKRSAEFYILTEPTYSSDSIGFITVNSYKTNFIVGGWGKFFSQAQNITVKFKDNNTEFDAAIGNKSIETDWYKSIDPSTEQVTEQRRETNKLRGGIVIDQYYIPNAGNKILKPQNNLYLTNSGSLAAEFNSNDIILNIIHLDRNKDQDLLFRLLTNRLSEEEKLNNYSFVLSNHLYILRRLHVTTQEIGDKTENNEYLIDTQFSYYYLPHTRRYYLDKTNNIIYGPKAGKDGQAANPIPYFDSWVQALGENPEHYPSIGYCSNDYYNLISNREGEYLIIDNLSSINNPYIYIPCDLEDDESQPGVINGAYVPQGENRNLRTIFLEDAKYLIFPRYEIIESYEQLMIEEQLAANEEIHWKIINNFNNDQFEYGKTQLDDDNKLVPFPVYKNNIKLFLQAEIKVKNSPEEGQPIFKIPLIIRQSYYQTSELNNWNNKFTIEESTKDIYGKTLIAGEKLNNNTFSGLVVGGHLSSQDLSTSYNKPAYGIFGYDNGVQTYRIQGDGTVILGQNNISLNPIEQSLTLGEMIIPPDQFISDKYHPYIVPVTENNDGLNISFDYFNNYFNLQKKNNYCGIKIQPNTDWVLKAHNIINLKNNNYTEVQMVGLCLPKNPGAIEDINSSTGLRLSSYNSKKIEKVCILNSGGLWLSETNYTNEDEPSSTSVALSLDDIIALKALINK